MQAAFCLHIVINFINNYLFIGVDDLNIIIYNIMLR